MRLTPAADGDLGEIADLVNRAYRSAGGWTHEGDYIGGERTSPANLRADLDVTPAARLLTLREPTGGDLLGVVWLEPAEDGAWYLGMLTVRQDRQDRKLGRALLDAAETYAAEQAARRIRITVVAVRDTLIAWYERRGYVATGDLEPFPYEDQRFGTPLRDDLTFVVLEKDLNRDAAS